MKAFFSMNNGINEDDFFSVVVCFIGNEKKSFLTWKAKKPDELWNCCNQ